MSVSIARLLSLANTFFMLTNSLKNISKVSKAGSSFPLLLLVATGVSVEDSFYS